MVLIHSPQPRIIKAILVGSALSFITAGSAGAAAFVPGDLALDRVGDGTNSPTGSSSNPLFLDERTSSLATARIPDDLAIASGRAIQHWNVDRPAWDSPVTVNTGANGTR